MRTLFKYTWERACSLCKDTQNLELIQSHSGAFTDLETDYSQGTLLAQSYWAQRWWYTSTTCTGCYKSATRHSGVSSTSLSPVLRPAPVGAGKTHRWNNQQCSAGWWWGSLGWGEGRGRWETGQRRAVQGKNQAWKTMGTWEQTKSLPLNPESPPGSQKRTWASSVLCPPMLAQAYIFQVQIQHCWPNLLLCSCKHALQHIHGTSPLRAALELHC